MPSNFRVTIKDSRDAIKALNVFKDEYLLDFINTEEIGIRDLADIRLFPRPIVFQRRIELSCCLELKTGNFKPGCLVQLMTYLRILDDKEKKPHETPSIGIVLCKNANKDFVEYVIQDYAKPMGVATYRLSEDMPEKLREALPDVEELKQLLWKSDIK